VTERTRLAVLGSPIAHSKSPAIHRAAYAALGLDWTYEAVDVTGEQLAEFVNGCDASWRGLSLTMPLKRDILPLLTEQDPLVEKVGGANTVLFDDGMRGFNTDVYGVIRSFADVGVMSLHSVQVLGAGATAASVIVAVAEMGAREVLVSARNPAKAEYLLELGERLGISLSVAPLAESSGMPDAIVSTLPGGSEVPSFEQATRASAVLFDVAYDPWPSELAKQWDAAGGTVIPGIELLINQAVGQIRIFLNGDATLPLPDEMRVIAAMRAAVG